MWTLGLWTHNLGVYKKNIQIKQISEQKKQNECEFNWIILANKPVSKNKNNLNKN